MNFTEILAGQASREEPQKQAILKHGVFVELTTSLHAGLSFLDALVVAAQAERVDVETAA